MHIKKCRPRPRLSLFGLACMLMLFEQRHAGHHWWSHTLSSTATLTNAPMFSWAVSRSNSSHVHFKNAPHNSFCKQRQVFNPGYDAVFIQQTCWGKPPSCILFLWIVSHVKLRAMKSYSCPLQPDFWRRTVYKGTSLDVRYTTFSLQNARKAQSPLAGFHWLQHQDHLEWIVCCFL